MLQTLKQNDEEKCVDTGSSGVDTRFSSQRTCLLDWDSVSTQPEVVSTLVTLPREQFCQFGTVCRHTPWTGRHTPETFSL
ncbi:hypothetical protein Taro_034829 [Colocasia esculenta]|uniref:Uncharacterized protein n=1 Tax=Colocasia esculenta TaxID=4460 RepID=A0A843W411_COLES|nr:hypothetical protein [Colocasia esculenta]